jgi:hypothetical protein
MTSEKILVVDGKSGSALQAHDKLDKAKRKS